jgi:hypothetical protein
MRPLIRLAASVEMVECKGVHWQARGAETAADDTVRRGVSVTERRADARRLIVEGPAPTASTAWPRGEVMEWFANHRQ